MNKFFTWCFISALALLLGACNDNSSSTSEDVISVVSLQVTPAQGSIAVGLEQQFVAQATMSDGSVINVTTDSRLTWNSNQTTFATIDNKGLATGVATGLATITATGMFDGTSLMASGELTVTDAVVTSLQLTPNIASIPVGVERQFTAIASLSDGSSQDVTNDDRLSWVSSAPTMATVSNDKGTKGLATGIATGSVIITASGMINGSTTTASAELTVTEAEVISLEVTPAENSVLVGDKVQYYAMATLSDSRVQEVTHDARLSWSTSDAAVATISNVQGNKGEVTGVSVGYTDIEASILGVSSNTATLSVTLPTITIEPSQNQLASLVLDSTDFAFWNATSINSIEGQAALKNLTQLVYNQFNDEFDFITVVMNNELVPPGMPTGEYTHIKNDVTGIGLPLSDKTTDFHSAGQLQGISFLYRRAYLSTSTYGPILHEMAHRWANWIVPTSRGGHWGPELGITGQLNNVSANYADIELYLMGLMESSEMTDQASIDAYNLIPIEQQIRTPNSTDSQKEFRVLLLILSDRDLTATEIENYNNGATLLARTDNPTQQGTNFHKMTRGRGTIKVNELDVLKK